MLFGEIAYLNTRQRPNYEIDVRSRHVEDRVTAGVDIAMSPRLTVEVAARQLTLRYDADAQFDGTALQRTLNRTTDGLYVSGSSSAHVADDCGARVETDCAIDSSSRRSAIRRSQRIMPGVEFRPQALIKGAAFVGYRKFVPSAPKVLPDFQGLVADLSLSYTLLERDQLRRDLPARPDLFLRRIPAVLHRRISRRVDPPRARKPDSTSWSPPIGIITSTRTSFRSTVPRCRDRLDADLVLLGQRRLPARHRRTHRLRRVLYRNGLRTPSVFRDYDRLHIGCSVTYGF